MSRAKVFLDANVFKFSAVELPRFRPREVTITWGGQEMPYIVYDLITVNPNESLGKESADVRAEAELLPEVAGLAASGLVLFQITTELQIELANLPNLDSKGGHFFGADCEIVRPPLQYSRVLFGGHDGGSKRAQCKFLCSLKHKRFLQLQRATGAYQGKNKINENQLLDAFHLWCAEHAGSDFFLSLDFTLAKVTKSAKRVRTVPVVRPSELLIAVRTGRSLPRSGLVHEGT
jgi:hypothetical protein